MSFYKEVPGRKTTLESTLKFDTEPTAGSTNPVTSDGVKEAIDGAVGDASEALQQQIDDIAEKAGSGYIPKGEATVATLNGLSGQENGELYTMTDAGTLTDGSLAVVAGDTVAWDATNSVWYKAMNYAPMQYGTNEVHNLPTTITAFRTGDVIPVDGPGGTAKIPKESLLSITKENAIGGDFIAVTYRGQITSTATYSNANDLPAMSYFYVNANLSNIPVSGQAFVFTLQRGSDTDYKTQIWYSIATNKVYYRKYNSGTWTSWDAVASEKYSAPLRDFAQALADTTDYVWTSGGYIHKSNGGVASYGTASYTGYIAVKNGDVIVSNARNANNAGYAIYDKDFTFLSGGIFGDGNGYATLTVSDADAAYIRMSNLENADNPTGEKFIKVLNNSLLQRSLSFVTDSYTTKTSLKYVKVNATPQSGRVSVRVYGDSQASDSATHIVVTSGFRQGQTIYITGRSAGTSTWGAVGFFADKCCISYEYTNNTAIYRKKFVIPEGCTEIRVNGSTTILPEIYIESVLSDLPDITNSFRPKQNVKNNANDRLKIAFVLDDGSVNDDRVFYLFQKYGLKASFAIPGTTDYLTDAYNETMQRYNFYRAQGHDILVHGPCVGVTLPNPYNKSSVGLGVTPYTYGLNSVKKSKEALEAYGIIADGFCYFNATHWNSNVHSIVANEFNFAVGSGMSDNGGVNTSSDNPLTLNRTSIDSENSVNGVKQTIIDNIGKDALFVIGTHPAQWGGSGKSSWEDVEDLCSFIANLAEGGLVESVTMHDGVRKLYPNECREKSTYLNFKYGQQVINNTALKTCINSGKKYACRITLSGSVSAGSFRVNMVDKDAYGNDCDYTVTTETTFEEVIDMMLVSRGLYSHSIMKESSTSLLIISDIARTESGVTISDNTTGIEFTIDDLVVGEEPVFV